MNEKRQLPDGLWLYDKLDRKEKLMTKTEADTGQGHPKKKRTAKMRDYFIQQRPQNAGQWAIAGEPFSGENARDDALKWLRENAKEGTTYRVCRVVTDEMSPENVTRTVLRTV